MMKQGMLVNENLEGGEYSRGLVQRLMLGLHGEWLPCPTSPTVTHTKTPRREGNTQYLRKYILVFEKVHFQNAKILSDLGEQRSTSGFADIDQKVEQ